MTLGRNIIYMFKAINVFILVTLHFVLPSQVLLAHRDNLNKNYVIHYIGFVNPTNFTSIFITIIGKMRTRQDRTLSHDLEAHLEGW